MNCQVLIKASKRVSGLLTGVYVDFWKGELSMRATAWMLKVVLQGIGVMQGLYRDNGKQAGNYYSRFRVQGLGW